MLHQGAMQMNRKLSFFLLIVLLSICFTHFKSWAETRYVSDNFKITMRTGSGSERKIIVMLRSGTKVELLEPGQEWSKIRYRDKEGWVLTRYLSSKEPCSLTLSNLNQRYMNLNKERTTLLEKNVALSAANKRLQSAFTDQKKNLEQVSSQYEILKQESSDFLKLKSDYERASKELAITKANSEKIAIENQRLRKNQTIKWFMVGAGVLMVGFIIGFVSRRPKRQPSLLG
jgi:SH3 domain protein